MKYITRLWKIIQHKIHYGLILQYRAVTGKKIQPKKWVFVIGCYNSGTTLMSRILSEHPDIASMRDEGAFYNDILLPPEEFGWSRLWIQCRKQIEIGGDLNANGSKLADRIKRQWSHVYDRPDAPLLLEKSISNMVRLKFLQEHFSPAYFIYMIRDGFAVSEGIQRKAKPQKWGNYGYPMGYPIELCAEQWHESDREFSKVSNSLSNLIVVRYEDFTNDPSATLRTLTDFLDIEPVSGDLLTQQWTIHEKSSIIRNMNDKSHNNLSKKQAEAIAQVASTTLEKYGYKNPCIEKSD